MNKNEPPAEDWYGFERIHDLSTMQKGDEFWVNDNTWNPSNYVGFRGVKDVIYRRPIPPLPGERLMGLDEKLVNGVYLRYINLGEETTNVHSFKTVHEWFSKRPQPGCAIFIKDEAEAMMKGDDPYSNEAVMGDHNIPKEAIPIEQDPLCQCGRPKSEHFGINAICHNFTPAKAESGESFYDKLLHESEHDNMTGPCACGAWHTPDEFVLKSSIRPQPSPIWTPVASKLPEAEKSIWVYRSDSQNGVVVLHKYGERDVKQFFKLNNNITHWMYATIPLPPLDDAKRMEDEAWEEQIQELPFNDEEQAWRNGYHSGLAAHKPAESGEAFREAKDWVYFISAAMDSGAEGEVERVIKLIQNNAAKGGKGGGE